jgi:hypothetical protein
MPTREQTATPASRAKIEDFVAKKKSPALDRSQHQLL